jgi:L-rhamnose-H+ transport protein
VIESDHAVLGLGILIVSGMLTASFPVPLKLSRAWRWENTWLVYASLALVAIPISIVALAVPNLGQVYGSVGLSGYLAPLLFGFCWGIAQLTFGLAIAAVGMAMAFAIVIGLSAALGSFIPLIVFHPRDLAGRPGVILLISVVLLAGGLVLYAQAGQRRELESGNPERSGKTFRKGLLLCIFTGCFGSMLNLGFAFSGRITAAATAHGATAARATFAVWAVVLAVGYLPSLVYTVHLLRKNRSASCFGKWPAREALLAALAAVLWLFGMLGYGIGATRMGAYGTSIGFAVCQTVLLLWSTVLGIMTGEWRAAAKTTQRRMGASVAVLITSVAVLGLGTLIH